MFCKNCGQEISNDSVYCPYCGAKIAQSTPTPTQPATKQTSMLAVVGLVLSFFMPLIGLICSIVARKKCREENLEGGTLALVGIVISALSIGLSIIIIISTVGLISCAAMMA